MEPVVHSVTTCCCSWDARPDWRKLYATGVNGAHTRPPSPNTMIAAMRLPVKASAIGHSAHNAMTATRR